jgi:outer membrane murein-binding lipoprotein Lpp
MAVIGARPATGFGGIWRRPRARTRPATRSRPRTSASRRRGVVASISAILVSIAAAAALGLFYLSQSTHVAAIGYQIDSLEAQVADLRAEQQQLTFRIGQARSPSTVAAEADPLRLVMLDTSVVRFPPPSIHPRRLK